MKKKEKDKRKKRKKIKHEKQTENRREARLISKKPHCRRLKIHEIFQRDVPRYFCFGRRHAQRCVQTRRNQNNRSFDSHLIDR